MCVQGARSHFYRTIVRKQEKRRDPIKHSSNRYDQIWQYYLNNQSNLIIVFIYYFDMTYSTDHGDAPRARWLLPRAISPLYIFVSIWCRLMRTDNSDIDISV